MSLVYLCPDCRAILNVEENIILSAKRKDGKGGLILLHPEVGNYAYLKHPNFNYEENEKLNFFCPVCNAKLESPENSNLAKLILKEKNGDEFNILFSQVAGEKSTYKIKGKNIEAFGEHKEKYIDFSGLSQIK